MPHPRRIESQAPLTKPLIVLRKVDFDSLSEESVEMLAQTNVNYLLTEGELVWFNDGYILNDMPRMSDLTREIMGHTTGFAVARTDTGEILAKFGQNGLKAAEQAILNAQMQIVTAINIDLDQEEAEAETVEA